MRILLVEHDKVTARSLELILMSQGIKVYSTDTAEEAYDLAMLYDYDLIIMEHQLPDGDGLSKILQKLRASRDNTPVLVLSHAEDTESKIKAFGLGADEYMTKPYHKDELLARVKAVVRRSQGHAQSIITSCGVDLNVDAQTVEVSGNQVHLTGKEYQMLELLFMRKGTMITKEMFLNHLYGGMDEPELKIIDVFICKLRKKLDQAGAANVVDTIWGRGYKTQEHTTKENTAQTLVDA